MKIYKPKFWDKKNSILSIILMPITVIIIIIAYFKKKIIYSSSFRIPVICIGNIYLGGTGKTPLSIFIAKKLSSESKNPAIIRKFYKNHIDEHDLIKVHYDNLILSNNRFDGITEAEKRKFDSAILDDGSVKRNRVLANHSKKHLFSLWDKTIIKKALNKLPFYNFNNIKRYFPSIKSMDDFVSKSKYFGGIVVEITGLEKDTVDLSRKQKLGIVISIAIKISNEITTTFGEYVGTKRFYREPIRKYFKNKKLSFSVNTSPSAETGKPTMRNNIDSKYFVDLNKSDWYVYNENYGSSEEKFLVKY